jgi:hypothetical protein
LEELATTIFGINLFCNLIFLYPKASRPALKPTECPTEKVLGKLPLEGRTLGKLRLKAGYSTLYKTEFKSM